MRDLSSEGIGLGTCARLGVSAFVFAAAPFSVAWAQQLSPWDITPTLSLSETFTDNEGLDPDGEKDPALITTVSPGLGITVNLPKVTANVSGELDFRYQALSDEGFDLSGALSGFTNVVWFDDIFFTDFRASVSQELLDSQDAQSASANNDENRETVQTYQVNPYLTNRLGDFADSELRYQFTYVDSTSSQLERSFDNDASWSLNSGLDFDRIQWTLLGQYAYLHRPEDNDIESYSGELDLRIVIDPAFSLLGNAGYQRFDDNDDDEFNEPIWEAGFLLTPGPRAELSYLYGKRNDSKSHTVSARYDIAAQTTIQAGYSEDLTSDQSRLGRNLSTIGSNSSGGQINTGTGTTFDSNPSSTSTDNETSRTKTGTLDVSSTFGRNTASINGRYEDRNVRNSPNDEQAWGGGFSFSRQFSPSLEGRLEGSYERRRFETSADTQTYIGGIGLSYALTQSISTFADYTYQRRTSSDPDEEFTENTATIGIDIAF